MKWSKDTQPGVAYENQDRQGFKYPKKGKNSSHPIPQSKMLHSISPHTHTKSVHSQA
jgi:hypothetical protein